MPYMRLYSPELSLAQKQRIARELTELVVNLMTPANGRGLSKEEMRSRCTVHFMPWNGDDFAIGGVLMSEKHESDFTLEFSDWGLNRRKERRLARQITLLLAKILELETSSLDQLNIKFNPYPPHEFFVAGKSLAERIPLIGRVIKKITS